MKKNKSDNTVLWWIGWITLTILTFFAASWFWTGFIADHVGPMDKPGVAFLWVACVFGTWMILLVPLIVLMYNKVDRAYEYGRILREEAAEAARRRASGILFDALPEEERLIDARLVKKLRKVPYTVKRGHLVNASLKDGRLIENVFIADREEMVGVYGYDKAPMKAADIADIEPVPPSALPDFKTERWLRFDP